MSRGSTSGVPQQDSAAWRWRWLQHGSDFVCWVTRTCSKCEPQTRGLEPSRFFATRTLILGPVASWVRALAMTCGCDGYRTRVTCRPLAKRQDHLCVSSYRLLWRGGYGSCDSVAASLARLVGLARLARLVGRQFGRLGCLGILCQRVRNLRGARFRLACCGA